MGNAIGVELTYKDREDRTFKYSLSNEKIEFINMFFNIPKTIEETVEKSKGDAKKDLVVLYYNRKMDKALLTLDFIVNKNTTLTLKNIFSMATNIEFKELNKYYNIQPYKLIINNRYTKVDYVTLVMYIEPSKIEITYNLDKDNLVLNNIYIGNKTKHFAFSGENLNGSTVKLSVKTDKQDNLYMPIVYIPFGVNNFNIDTKNNIYTADGKNLLNASNYTSLKEYKKFVNCITNSNIFNFNKADFKTEFSNGNCVLKIYKEDIF